MRPRRLLAAIVPLGAIALVALSAACTTTANISEVYTALDSEGFRRRSVFFTDTKEIHCIAEGSFGRPDVTVEGFIHQVRVYNSGKDDFDGADRYIGYVEIQPAVSQAAAGPTKIDLLLGRTDQDGKDDDKAPYAAGSYICEVAIDGAIVKTASFNIDFPECPPAEIVAGLPCIGFFKDKATCPRFGLLSDDKKFCNCSIKGWECDR